MGKASAACREAGSAGGRGGHCHAIVGSHSLYSMHMARWVAEACMPAYAWYVCKTGLHSIQEAATRATWNVEWRVQDELYTVDRTEGDAM